MFFLSSNNKLNNNQAAVTMRHVKSPKFDLFQKANLGIFRSRKIAFNSQNKIFGLSFCLYDVVSIQTHKIAASPLLDHTQTPQYKIRLTRQPLSAVTLYFGECHRAKRMNARVCLCKYVMDYFCGYLKSNVILCLDLRECLRQLSLHLHTL